MTTELNLIAALSHNPAEPLTVAQKEALQRAVSKIVALGAHVGVNRDQRILLESGLAVGELLEYLAARSGEVGLKRSNLVLKFCPVGEICGSPLRSNGGRKLGLRDSVAALLPGSRACESVTGLTGETA